MEVSGTEAQPRVDRHAPVDEYRKELERAEPIVA